MAIYADLSGNRPDNAPVTDVHIATPGGSGGGGDATAANQVLTNTKLDTLLSVVQSSSSSPVVDGGSSYSVVPVSTTAQAIGDANDTLASVAWKAGATPTDVIILDGATEIARIAAAEQTANSQGILYFGWTATTGWKITTSTGTSAIAGFNPRP